MSATLFVFELPVFTLEFFCIFTGEPLFMINIIGVDSPSVHQSLIAEFEEGNWGIAGKGLTATNVHDLVMGKTIA